MIVIRLKGGMGNQMFQYAFGKIFAKNKKEKLLIDSRFFEFSKEDDRVTARDFELQIFNNCYKEASDKQLSSFDNLSRINRLKRKFNLNYPKKYHESNFGFNPSVFNSVTPIYLNGYFQSYKYFTNYEKEVCKLFQFPVTNLDEKNSLILNEIKENITVSIHIRRGDYVSVAKVKETLVSCSLEYYTKAINLMLSKYKDAKLVFFSDDSEWVKEKFSFITQDKIFIDHNTESNSWKDMCLMTFCSHNIIANSSFSWWAAWLNSNPQKSVVAPKKWFVAAERETNDLIPLEWIRL